MEKIIKAAVERGASDLHIKPAMSFAPGSTGSWWHSPSSG
jgi:hypothetical protein